MADAPPEHAPQPMLSLRLGRWFEAKATGWGVAALPVVLVVIAAAAALGYAIRP